MLENKEVSRNRLKEFGCFNMERREQSVRGFGKKKKKIITRKKNVHLFSISMEEQIIGNGLRLQHNGGYEYESISSLDPGTDFRGRQFNSHYLSLLKIG